MFSKRPWRVAVNTNMSPKWQAGTLTFPLRFPIINRTTSDLLRPSVHHPSLPAAGSLGIPYSQPYSGPPARKHFLQDKFQIAERTTAKSADAHVAPPARLLCSLYLLLPFLRKSTRQPSRPAAGKMFSERPWGVAVHTNMPKNLASWLVVFSVASSYYKTDVL